MQAVHEVNGDSFGNLHLFANALEENPPEPDAPNVLFLKPAIHRMEDIYGLAFRGSVAGNDLFWSGDGLSGGDDIPYSSGKTFYIARGPLLWGPSFAIMCRISQSAAEGCCICPTFIGFPLSGAPYHLFAPYYGGRSVLLDPPQYSIYIGQSEHIRIRNFKSFSTRGWCDGIDMMSSSHIEIEDVFLRTSDDCIAVYGSRWDYKGDSRCVSVKDSVLWADVAHAMNIGGHGDYRLGGDLIEDIQFSNIDILEHHEPQPGYWGAMNINVGDKNTVRNVIYDNIRVEDFELGQLLDIRVVWNEKYNPVAGKRIENIHFRNVTYNGKNENKNRIYGFDHERRVEGVTFTNLRINGELILSAEQGNFEINEFVSGIQFRKEL